METEHKRYTVNPNFLLREIVGESVLVPVGEAGVFENSMISPNSTFSFLFRFFQQPHTLPEAVAEALNHFDGDEQEIEQDIRNFMTESIAVSVLQEVF